MEDGASVACAAALRMHASAEPGRPLKERMRYIFTLVLSLSIVTAAWAARPGKEPAESSESALVSRARQVVGEMLARLPNYTCLETLERTQRVVGERKFRLLDRARVEVAFVNGTELFAWPGSTEFDGTGLNTLLVGPGAFSTGDFGQHLRFTYRSELPLRLAGKVRLNGREAWKFTQSLPADISHYEVIVPPAKAVVGYALTAWHDASSLELLRLELLSEEFPKEISLRRTFKAIEYATAQVNGLPVRLPSMTELSMTTLGGVENRTVSTFSNCHEYKGESTLTFEEPAPEQAARRGDTTHRRPAAADLPAGVEVQVKLDDAVDLRQAARGDQVSMTVSRDAMLNGNKVLSAGARVNARWKLIECSERPIAYCFAILDTESFADGASSGRFRGSLVSPSVERELALGGRGVSAVGQVIVPDGIRRAEKGAPVLYVGIVTRLPRGYRLIWRTLEVSGGTKP